MKEVLIIGGGFAGLAAGVFLSDQGHSVTLIERKNHLGGRAYSFRDPATGSTLDNGQHVFMGCYRETIAFLEKIGTLDKISFQKDLSVHFASPGGSSTHFKLPPLPSPLNLLMGLIFFGGASMSDKLKSFCFKKHLLQARDDRSVSQWLKESGQSQRIQEGLWNPVALATLNDRPEISSSFLFAKVIQDALFSGRKNSRVGIASVGLSELYTEAARDYIERKGGQVLLKALVMRLHFKEREFQEVELDGGRRISAENLLVTVPFTALKKMLPEELVYEDPFFAPLGHLKPSPIVSINLWFDREITDQPFIGFWGTRLHWLFNKGRLFKDGPPYITLVISGAREELQIPGPQLIEMALEELRSIFPEVRQAKLLHSMVTKEPEATLSPAVGVGRFRLSQKTPYPNFFLAGDWTDTGLPATIESAVVSAKRAVELIQNS